MTASEKMMKAKTFLLLNHPFFAIIALQMEYKPADVKDVSIDGKTVFYNTAYVDSITERELSGLLAHEVMHVALCHHTRRAGRDLKMWNRAADYALNPLLKEAGIALPKGALLLDAFEGLTAEQIYSLFPTSDDPNDGNDPDNPPGEVLDAPGDNMQEVEAEVKMMVTEAREMANRKKSLQPGLDRTITETLQPKIDWLAALAQFLAVLTKNDYTWSKPNRRYLCNRLYLPSRGKYEPGRLIIIVDTSGSINKVLLAQFGAEVQHIATSFNIDITVIYVDQQVRNVQLIERDEPINLQAEGGGGTDFRPGFAYIEEHDMEPKAVVYITDGDCKSYPDEPDYPVLWAKFGLFKGFTPPFGEIINVE